MNIGQAAAAPGVAASTVHRWLNEGIIAGEQLTPGAPWRIRLTDDIKARFSQNAGEGFLPMREAMRALGYVTAASLDYAARHPDEKVRREHKAFVELMIPVVKGWCTESAVELCSTALQVFGGMGYIEETGIAQQYRDVRIITIYEGTTGIQALDLIGRKLLRDMGATATVVGKKMETVAKECAAHSDSTVKRIGESLGKALATLNETSQWIGMNAMGDLHKAFACSVPYLRLWGVVAGGWQMAAYPDVSAELLEIMKPGFDTKNWLRATVPGTVLTTMIDRGIYPDPDYGLNNLVIPESLAHRDYWYRVEFKTPADTRGQRLTPMHAVIRSLGGRVL